MTEAWGKASAGLRSAFSEGRVTTLLLGVLVALLSWNLGFAVPQTGLDPSWTAGLYMATHQGLDFGSEIVFTYGPLGFLRLPALWYSDLAALAYAYSAVLQIGMACSLVWALRGWFGALPAFLGAFLVLTCVPMLDPAMGIAIIWSYALLTGRAPARRTELFAGLAGAVAAIEVLGKLSTGPVIVVVLLLGLAGARAPKRAWAAFGAAFVVSFSASWLAAGQGLGSLPDFVRNSVEIVAGYNEAMGSTGTTFGMVALPAAVALITVVWAWFGGYGDRRARIIGTAIAAIVCLAAYKQAVVRGDEAHRAIFFATMIFLWAAVPPLRRLRPASAAAVAALAAAAALTLPAGSTGGLDPVDNLEAAFDGTRTMLDSERREEQIAQGRLTLALYYGVPQNALRQLVTRRVSVARAETAVAWAYGFDWDPPPVFQDYSAYTPALDRLNADSIASEDGPQRILVQNAPAFDPRYGTNLRYTTGSIEGRYPGWDPPRQALETVCHFAPRVTSERWQVLARTGDRCGRPRRAGTVEAGRSEWVRVPAPAADELVYVKVHGLEVRGLERLQSLLYKPEPRFGAMEDGTLFRLPPGLAEDGLLLRAGPGVGSTGPPYGLIPQTSRLLMLGGSGDLRFEFFRVRARPPERGPAPGAG